MIMRGDNLSPAVKTGDILIYSVLSDMVFIPDGEMYVISFTLGDTLYRAVGIIRESEENPDDIKFYNAVKDSRPVVVPKNNITALAMVHTTVNFHSFY